MTTGILLGGGVFTDGTLPKNVEKRITKTVALYNKRIIDMIIVTGGHTNPATKKSEAAAMAKILIAQGIPKRNILLEQRALDTIGNAIFTKEIITHKKRGKNLILITSSYHMRRALSIFRHVFGKGYHIQGKASYGPFIHHFKMLLYEWEKKEIENVFLDAIPPGNHKKALLFLYQHIPQYQEMKK